MFNKFLLSLLIISVSGLASLLVSPSARAALSDSEIREAISDVLVQLHPTDTADWWRGLGPDTPSIIISMYDQESFVYHRLRLVQALAWFDDPAGTAFLERQANDTPDDVIRNGAIQSLGTSQGAREDDFIGRFLASEDPQTRLIAAQALRKAGDAKAQDYLARFLAEEKVQWVKDRFKTAPLAPAPMRIEHPSATASGRAPLNADFEGSWSGNWLVPRFAEESGFENEPLTLELAFEKTAPGEEKTLRGKIVVKAPPNIKNRKSIEVSFEHAVGSAARFHVELPWAPFKAITSGRAGDTPTGVIFEVELLPEQKSSQNPHLRTLRVGLGGVGAVGTLRR